MFKNGTLRLVGLIINEREVGKTRRKSRSSRKVVKIDRRIGTRQERY
jgi:hypothetical protein